MMGVNRTKQKLNYGKAVFGVFVPIMEPRIVELCGLAGFDYVVIDAEHAPIGYETCENMVRAAEGASLTPIVRVPDPEPKTISRFLDTGALGVMVPQVNTMEIAEKVIAAVKYGPLGHRGLAPTRAASYGLKTSLSEYVAQANRETIIVAQLEDVRVLAELAGILELKEIDAFELGTADLSQSLGFPGETSRREVTEVVSRIEAMVFQVNRILGDTANSVEAAQNLLSRGYRMIDCNFLRVASTALTDLSLGMHE